VRGRGRTSQPSLADRGLVEARSADPEAKKSTHHLYLTEKGARLLETAKKQKTLLGFRFEDRKLDDKEKEEIITTALRLADDRIPPNSIKEIIRKAKKTKTWKEATDDRTLYRLMKSIEKDYTHERLKIMRKTSEPPTTELREQICEETEEFTKKRREPRGERRTREQAKLADYRPETIVEAVREAERMKKPKREVSAAPTTKRRQTSLADFHPDSLPTEEEKIPEPKIEEPDLRIPSERVIFKTKTEKKVYDFIRQQSQRNKEELGQYGCLDVEIEERLDMKSGLVKEIIDRLVDRGMIVNQGGWLLAREPGPSAEEKERPEERREEEPVLGGKRRERLRVKQGKEEEALAGVTGQEEEGEDLDGVSELAQQVYEFIKEHNERHASIEEYMGCHRFRISEAFDVPEEKLDEALVELEKQKLIVRHLEFFALKELEPAFWVWSL